MVLNGFFSQLYFIASESIALYSLYLFVYQRDKISRGTLQAQCPSQGLSGLSYYSDNIWFKAERD